MTESLRHMLDSVLLWLTSHPSLYGAGGAMLRATRTGRSWKQIVTETLGGVFVANMIGPLLSEHAHAHWHATLYFIAGWGGLELVAWAYDQAVKTAELRLRSRFGNGQWDGKERRKS